MYHVSENNDCFKNHCMPVDEFTWNVHLYVSELLSMYAFQIVSLPAISVISSCLSYEKGELMKRFKKKCAFMCFPSVL